jgi:hypothetical protein
LVLSAKTSSLLDDEVIDPRAVIYLPYDQMLSDPTAQVRRFPVTTSIGMLVAAALCEDTNAIIALARFTPIHEMLSAPVVPGHTVLHGKYSDHLRMVLGEILEALDGETPTNNILFVVELNLEEDDANFESRTSTTTRSLRLSRLREMLSVVLRTREVPSTL